MSKDLRRKRVKQRKILKKLTLAGLAVVIGAAGIFAFAPIGASASEPSATTTSGLGLDPKNDPVVYTTESGLEIRMSGTNQYTGTVTTTTNRGYTYTQDLTSFYYFTMGTYSGTIYTAASGSKTANYVVSNEPINWIILGLGENTAYFLDEVAKNLFSTWKDNNISYANSNGASGSYFFSDIYETYSPAGQLIDSVVSAKTYIMDKVKASIPIDPADEIPEGCMLVLSEKLLGQSYFNSSGGINDYVFTGYTYSYVLSTSDSNQKHYGNRYRYMGKSSTTSTQTWTISGNAGGTLYNYITNLFNKNTSGTILSNSLGFSATEANLVVPQQLYTYYYNGSSHLQETPSSDSGSYYTMFPLAYRTANTSISQNYCIEDYLNTNNKRTATLIGSSSNQSFFWGLRSGYSGSSGVSNRVFRVVPSGEITDIPDHNTLGVRPAMVMKLQ